MSEKWDTFAGYQWKNLLEIHFANLFLGTNFDFASLIVKFCFISFDFLIILATNFDFVSFFKIVHFSFASFLCQFRFRKF